MHLWEYWQQTGLQGDWHSHFGGRWHDFDTLPLFVRMPYEDGDDVPLEQLLSDWANEANGQCLGAGVQHIVFHIGRYYHCTKAKAWVKHHHRLQIPSTFQCAQRTSTGHGGHGTFVLRGVIAHQGEALTSGHYVSLLVEGDALWSVDDDQCPQAQKHIPEIFHTGAVMIWASKAEHSHFWTKTIGSFEPPAKRQRIQGDGVEVFYSNITQWNNAAREWVQQTEHQVVMLVETHLHGHKLEQVTALPAWETGRGGNSGGHLFSCREGQSSYRLHHYDLNGNGFLANVLQRQHWELVLVSIYLKCGEDLNSHVLGQLAAFLTELAVPWVVLGDFQVPPEQWEGHNLLNVLKAEVVSCGQSTVTTGGELDYALASCKIAPFLELQPSWDVPWKPRAGPQFAAVPRLEEASRGWDEFEPQPKFFWLGKQGGPKEMQCAEWCHQAEQYALQNLQHPKQGRGWYLALELKPLPATRPLSPWKKGDLAYWGQFCSLLAHVANKDTMSTATMLHLRAKAADLDKRWQEVHGKEAFTAALEDLLNGDSRPLTLLITGAEANKDYAKKQAMELQSKEYQVWLAQATLKGCSGIYKSLKAPDAVHVRPFRNVPVPDRQKLREKQWYGQWEVIDKPLASAERERLRWEAVQ